MEKVLNIILFTGIVITLIVILLQPRTSLREDYEKSIEACNHNPTCIQEINHDQ